LNNTSDLPCEKCWKNFFREKENDRGQTQIYAKKEHQEWISKNKTILLFLIDLSEQWNKLYMSIYTHIFILMQSEINENQAILQGTGERN
jgi:hypothetical protein